MRVYVLIHHCHNFAMGYFHNNKQRTDHETKICNNFFLSTIFDNTINLTQVIHTMIIRDLQLQITKYNYTNIQTLSQVAVQYLQIQNTSPFVRLVYVSKIWLNALDMDGNEFYCWHLILTALILRWDLTIDLFIS